MKLVVYGTFREGGMLAHHLKSVREKGTSEIVKLNGVRLYVAGMAPGAIITGYEEDETVAELITADLTSDEERDLFEMLDYVEGVSMGLYERNEIDIGHNKAIIYTYCRDVEGCPVITDWMEWDILSVEEKLEALKEVKNSIVCI